MEFLSVNFVIAVLICLLLGYLVYQHFGQSHGLKKPPGPLALPIIGAVWKLERKYFQFQLSEFAKQYGRIFSIQMGPKYTIFLNDYPIIKDAFVGQAEIFNDRADDFISKVMWEDLGIAGASGEIWKQQRRFSLHLLRDMGFGKVVLEERIAEICDGLMNEMRKHNGKPFDYHWTIMKTISNVICSIVFGIRFEYDDPEFEDFFQNMENLIHSMSPIVNAFPFLRHIPGDPFNYGTMVATRNKMDDYIRGHIERRRKEFAVGRDETAECFIDAYLEKIEQEKDNPDTTFHELQAIRVVGNLFVAGTDTTASTLRWALLYLAKHQECQARVRKEIWNVIGREKMVSTRDRQVLPLTDATIQEVMRMRPGAPFGVPHACSKDTKLDGFDIPAKTVVFPNIYAIFHNPEIFEDPETFKPERFLDENNNVKKLDNFIPFSTGKRTCLGESLAKMELLLFLTTLIQRFEFKLPEEDPPPNMDGLSGMIYKPCKHRIIATSLETD